MLLMGLLACHSVFFHSEFTSAQSSVLKFAWARWHGEAGGRGLRRRPARVVFRVAHSDGAGHSGAAVLEC